MKLLYLTLEELKIYDGVGKKIIAQYNSLNKIIETELFYIDKNEKNIYRRIYKEKNFLEKVKNTLFLKQYLYNKFDKIMNYIISNNINIIYIRYSCSANLFFIKFLEKLKKLNKIIILEIPTYPYDGEIKNNKNLLKSVKYKIEKKYRKKLKKYVDRIVTFSEDNEIFGIKTIKISNGIDIDNISIINPNPQKEINFTVVARISFWHGIDRFILSMIEYYKNKSNKIIKFNIVGDGDKKVVDYLKKIVKENKLEECVLFHGYKAGKDLDEIYDKTNIAVGSLGRHRSGVYVMKTLKNREYAAKGLPMIFSENDLDFKNVDFVYKIAPDESLIDIEKIIEWYKSLKITSQKIRKFSEKFSWDIQMKKVVDEINKLCDK